MVIDWLISGLHGELSAIDATDPEGAESHLESSESLKWLHQIKNSANTDKFIDLADEIKDLAYRWEYDPRSLEAARITLASTECLDNESLSFLRGAITLLSKSHARTKIVAGRPVFPSINGSRFSSQIYYLEDIEPKSEENQLSESVGKETRWISAFEDGEYCKTCRHWSMGYCKRNPPVDGEFPWTKSRDTCGEWDK